MAAAKSDLLNFEKNLKGKTILVTGHTGFTGSWLSLWLHAIGCRVVGIGLKPRTTPNLYDAADVGKVVESHILDIADAKAVHAIVEAAKPVAIIHLAAQPLVSHSFIDPIETFATNVSGTAHVLEAARHVSSVKSVVCITTDKVYKDRDWHWGYRETDELGGKDPYSASKSCAEIVIASYQQTLANRGNGVRIAAARGGNIIGGGDWSDNRIVPDFVRALQAKEALVLRNPGSTRPWQHVLALAHAYIQLTSVLLSDDGAKAVKGWNFGPGQDGARNVGDLVKELGKHWEEADIRLEPGSFPETRFLHLDSTLARQELGWAPPLRFEDTVALTAKWYAEQAKNPAKTRAITEAQISDYRQRLAAES